MASDTAEGLIETSLRERRTVTAHPSSSEEYETLLADLIADSEGDTDSAECSGEPRGYTDVWSDDGWRVHLMHPPE